MHTGEFDWLAGLEERSKIEIGDLRDRGESLHEHVVSCGRRLLLVRLGGQRPLHGGRLGLVHDLRHGDALHVERLVRGGGAQRVAVQSLLKAGQRNLKIEQVLKRS